MKIRVHLSGPIVLAAGAPENPVELEEGRTIDRLLSVLGFSERHLVFFRVAVGGEVASRGTFLQDGDEVTIMIPIGGG